MMGRLGPGGTGQIQNGAFLNEMNQKRHHKGGVKKVSLGRNSGGGFLKKPFLRGKKHKTATLEGYRQSEKIKTNPREKN